MKFEQLDLFNIPSRITKLIFEERENKLTEEKMLCLTCVQYPPSKEKDVCLKCAEFKINLDRIAQAIIILNELRELIRNVTEIIQSMKPWQEEEENG